MSQRISLSTIQPKLKAFAKFLLAGGAVPQDATNEYELLRFKALGVVGIVYRNERGQATLTGPAEPAWEAFRKGKIWTAFVPTKRRCNSPYVDPLLKRDGDCCFLCRLPLGDDISVEHLVSVSAKGPNHIDNFVLTHEPCNVKLGNKSVMEKILMREQYQPLPEAPKQGG